MTQSEQLERLRMVLVELVQFLKIASEACQELADKQRSVGGTAAGHESPDLLIGDGGPRAEGERPSP